MTELKLAAPWTTFFRKIEAMFKLDSEVEVRFDETDAVIYVLCSNAVKADALVDLLPSEVQFGNVIIKIRIEVYNSNKLKTSYSANSDLLKDAFNGNDAVVDIKTVTDICRTEHTFVVFKPVVVQFFNDDTSDLNGLCHTLYQDIARDVFNPIGNVCYCTEALK